MAVKLVCIDAVRLGETHSLDSFPQVVGRGPDAGVRVDDRWASRMHCELDLVDGLLTVRDLDSQNGTIVNGNSISQSRLEPGDRLTIGISSFEVVSAEPPPAVCLGNTMLGRPELANAAGPNRRAP